MKILLPILMLAGLVLPTASALADADDVKWIAQCLKDNKREGASEDVVYKYCKCMNNKMSSNETQSITQWEKSHPEEQKACDKEAGWK